MGATSWLTLRLVPKQKRPRASVVVPVGDDALRLEWTLAGLATQTMRDFEAIVVLDGGPTAVRRTAQQFARDLDLKVCALRGPKRATRSGAARNAGVRRSRSDLLIFLDGDMVPDADFVEAHVSHYSSDTALFGFRRRYPVELVAAYKPPLDYSPLEQFSRPDSRLFGYASWPKPELYLHFLSCNASVSAEAFCRVGGFDERFVGWGGEDIDLGYRLHASGCRIFALWGIGLCTHLDHAQRDPEQDQQPWLCNPNEPLCRNGRPLRRRGHRIAGVLR